MPPKVKISQATIVNAAIELIREKGMESLNARELAKKLGCSTQPIFRTFANMEELKKFLYIQVEEFYNQYVLKGMNSSIPFLGIGLAYIDFAFKEKNLFKLLFMSDHFKTKSVHEMVEGEDNKEIIRMISKSAGLSEAAAKQLFLEIWLVTHGIASFVATNTCGYGMEEIEGILKDAFVGFKLQLERKEKGEK